MVSTANQAAFSVGANLARTYAQDWCRMTFAQREEHEFDIMHYIDSEPGVAIQLSRMFDVTLVEATLAVDVAEWLVCNFSMFEDVATIDAADLIVAGGPV